MLYGDLKLSSCDDKLRFLTHCSPAFFRFGSEMVSLKGRIQVKQLETGKTGLRLVHWLRKVSHASPEGP